MVGRHVDVRGTATQVVVLAAGHEIARHPRGTRQTLVLEPTHYEGESPATVRAPTPLGRRAQWQLAAVPHGEALPTPEAMARPQAQYHALLARTGT